MTISDSPELLLGVEPISHGILDIYCVGILRCQRRHRAGFKVKHVYKHTGVFLGLYIDTVSATVLVVKDTVLVVQNIS